MIYRPQLFPDITKTLVCWQNEAKKFGHDGLHIGYMQSFGFREAPEKYGFECAVQFQPNFFRPPKSLKYGLLERVVRRVNSLFSSSVHKENTIVSYEDYVNNMLKVTTADSKTYPSVCPMWSNSPRRQKGAFIFTDSTPELYEKWLRHAVNVSLNSNREDDFLFINAWNEWAEGNHLEPCQKWGHRYLETTKRVLIQ